MEKLRLIRTIDEVAIDFAKLEKPLGSGIYVVRLTPEDENNNRLNIGSLDKVPFSSVNVVFGGKVGVMARVVRSKDEHVVKRKYLVLDELKEQSTPGKVEQPENPESCKIVFQDLSDESIDVIIRQLEGLKKVKVGEVLTTEDMDLIFKD